MFHRGGRGFLGFKKVTSQNATANLKTVTINDINTTYYSPYTTETNTYLLSTNAQLTHNTYSTSFQNTVGTSFFQKLNSSTEQNLLTGATNTSTNVYDNANGNVTQNTTNINNIETIVTNTA